MAVAPETAQEVQVYLLEPTELEMESFLYTRIGTGEKVEEIDVLAMGDQEIKEEKEQEIKEEKKDQEIKEEKEDQEIKEEKNNPEYDVEYFSSPILREILPNETSTRSQYHVLPIPQMVQPKNILDEEMSPHVQDLNNDAESAFSSLIDRADFNQRVKEQRGDCLSSDKPTACVEGFLICAKCDKQFISKTTLIRHIKIHDLQFGVTRNRNDFTECNDVGDSRKFNQQMKKECLDSKSSDKSTAHIEKSVFICAECDKKFTSRTTLIRHIKGHALKFGVTRERNDFTKSNDIGDSFSCASCQKIFRFKADLIGHVKKHQRDHDVSGKSRLKDNLFSCGYCSDMFKLKSALISHIRKHQDDPDFSNTIWLNKKSRLAKLKLHFPKPNDKIDKCRFENSLTEFSTLRSKNIKTNFICAHCDKKFKFKTDLLLHINSHMKKPYWLPGNVHCPICGRKFPFRKCLRDHIATHFKETFFQCKQCSFCAIKKYSVLQHTLISHCEGSLFQCEICEETFPSYLTFRRHKKKHLNKENSSSKFTSAINKRFRGITSSQEKAQPEQTVSSKFSNLFKCSLCNASFRTKDDLNSHIKLRHDLKCRICSKVLSTRHELSRHYLRTHSSARNCSCNYCGSEFASKVLVRRHIMKHPEFKYHVPKMKCKLCGVLIRCNSIYSHNITQHKRKTYVCEQCGAVFARSDYLKKHMFKHTKERPHLCSYCAATFSRKDNLKSHERKHAILGDLMKPNPPVWKRPLTAEIDALAVGDQEIKEEKDDSGCNVNHLRPQIPRKILQNETSSRSRYHELPITQMVQPEQILEKGGPPPVHALNNDDNTAFFSDHDMIDRERMKERTVDYSSSDEPSACVEEGFLICAECNKQFTSKTTLIRHIKIHNLQFGVTRKRNDFTECNNVCDSAELNQKIVEQNLDSESSDKSTARIEESVFTCAKCNEKFTSNTLLALHMKVHALKFGGTRKGNDFTKSNEIVDSLTCAKCYKMFRFEVELISHMKEHQSSHDVPKKNRSEDESFSCAHCNEMFKLKSDLDTHTKKHQNVPDNSNIILLEKNSRIGKLKLHFPKPIDEMDKRRFGNSMTEYCTLRSENIKPRFFCAHCKRKFKFKTDLLIHLDSHMKKFRFAGNVHCPICGRKMPYRRCLRDHIATHFRETFYQCNQCSHTAIKKYSLFQHTLYFHCKGSSFQCTTCEETFSSYLTFRRHKQSAHSKQENSSSKFNSAITSSQEKAQPEQTISAKSTNIFKCSLCNGSFQTDDDLDSHIKLTHELRCKTCSKVYRTRHEFARHCLRLKCSVRSFACDYCGSMFASKKLVKKHIMGHSVYKNKIKKIECKLCGVLILHTSLYSHNITQHNRKTYVCEQCGAVFARSDYLKKHMFKHTKERPHLCSYCAATFSRKDNLKSHERKHAILGDLMKPNPPVWKRPL